MATERPNQMGDFLRSRSGVVLLVFLGVAAFYLITEHGAHLFGFLPFALLLLCPLMHLFMHRRRGSHGAPGSDPGGAPRRSEP